MCYRVDLVARITFLAWAGLMGARGASAATCTWTGAGSTDAWSVAANWDGCGAAQSTPRNGDRLVFPGGASRASAVNDLVGLVVNGIVISGVPASGARYALSGNGVTLVGALQFGAPADGSGQGPAFGVPIALGSAATISNTGAADARMDPIELGGFPLTLSPSGGDLVVAGVISGAGGIVKDAARTLVLLGPSTYTGQMQIAEGTVRVEHPTALGSATAGTTVSAGGRLLIQDPMFLNEPIVLDGGTIATVGGPPLSTGERYVVMPWLTLTSDSALELARVTSIRFTELEGAFVLATFGAGSFYVGEPYPAFTGRIVLHGGNFYLEGYGGGFRGSMPAAAIEASEGNVWGGGRVGTLTVSNGILWPYYIGGYDTGDLTLRGGASLFADMFPESGTSFYSRLRVTGTVTLANPILRPLLSYGPMGTVFTIIENDGTDPIVGTFAGLPEGAIVTSFSSSFVVSYLGGDGNDVTLTRSPRPPYVLSEGATGPFFDEDVLIANPNGPAPVSLTFLTADGRTIVQNRTLPASSRTTIHVDEIEGLEAAAVSTIVTSTDDLPLAVERTMFWDGTHYAGHTGGAAQPSLDWLFAEGAQGFFHTYVMLANANAAPADVSLTFLREGAGPVVKHLTVAPSSRVTIDCGAIAEMVDTAFGLTVRSNRPIVAERAMYFGSASGRLFSGGHDSPGVMTPAGSWFFAEGATGDFFDTFVLLSNPQSTPALVTLRYLLDAGESITRTRTIPPMARLTVNIEDDDDPRLKHAAVSTLVTSDVPIVAERSMYWRSGAPWVEGHNSFGVVRGGVEWLLAEGRVGGPSNFHTYILIANPSEQDATVRVTFLRETGFPLTRDYQVGAGRRFNIDVNAIPELQGASVAALLQVFSGADIVVERSMYWDVGDELFKGGTNAVGEPRWP